MTPGLVKLELGKVDSTACWFVAHIIGNNKRGPGIKFSSGVERFEVNGSRSPLKREDLLLLTIKFELDCRPMAMAYLLGALTTHCRQERCLRDDPQFDRDQRVFTCLLDHNTTVDRRHNDLLIVGDRLWHLTLIDDALRPALAKRGAASELFNLSGEEPPANHHELRAS